MGVCASQEEKVDQQVGRTLSKFRLNESEIFKLLLLGTGESGKSTFYKQIVCSYGSGFSRDYRLSTISSIHSQMIKSMKTLAEICDQRKIALSGEMERSKEFMIQLDALESVNQEVAHHMQKLWECEEIKKLLADKVHVDYELPDSTEHFLSQIPAVCDPLYVPSNADLFRVRVPTTGIQEGEFIVKGVRFLLVDVGGQRNERRKWINCFDNVTAVLFFVAISEYDQVLYEDKTVNRMRESIEMFKKVANEYMQKQSIILFFNKMDKLEEKIKSINLKDFFPEYDGPLGDSEHVFQFFKKLFLGLNENKERVIYAFPSCATDTKVVKKIFDSIKDTILRSQLEKSALL
jgi:GTPase SAR1 family protein